MAQKTTNKAQIHKQALTILESAPDGVRYSDLVAQIKAALPGIPVNTIHGNVWNLDVLLPLKVIKPARGLYLHATHKASQEQEPSESASPIPAKIGEADFYDPFASWLEHELEECTTAIALGGNKLKDKWGTPDVIGIREPRKSHIVQFSTEIVSAEIKLDAANLITAFGQACSYQLFSHKSYLVVPRTSSKADISRLDALCGIFGIGLVLFEPAKPEEPAFEIRVRPTRHEPDMFYANQKLKLIETELYG